MVKRRENIGSFREERDREKGRNKKRGKKKE